MSDIDTPGLRDLLLAGPARLTHFAPNSGNAGDSLIAEASYQFLDGIGLAYQTVDLAAKLEKPGRLIVGGGGNLVKPYRNARRFIEAHLDRYDELIILPHSIQAHEDLLARLDARATIICRERRSFDFCTRHAPAARVLLGHDMALLWQRDANKARARRALSASAGAMRFHIRNLKLLVRGLTLHGQIRNGALNAFRLDVESKGGAVPPHNLDLSTLFATDSMAWPYAARAVDALADFIDRAQIIRTDRLHIAILAALLGKTVEMHDNNYGKNSAVYAHSLAERFPNIQFMV